MVFAARIGVDERAQLAVVETLVAEAHGRYVADVNRGLAFGILLNTKNVDVAGDARAVTVPQEDAAAGYTEAARITGAFEITAAPGARAGIDLGWHGQHPVQMLEVAEKAQLPLEAGESRARIALRRERVDLAAPADPHGRHVADRRVERAGLTARGVVREVRALRVRGRRPGEAETEAGEGYSGSRHAERAAQCGR